MHALTAPRPWGRMPAVLPEARAPRDDVSLHGGNDLRTQARHRIEHRPIECPVGGGREVRQIEPPPLLPCGQMPDDQASLGQDRALVLGGAPLEGPIPL
jgi:hypothetical protein